MKELFDKVGNLVDADGKILKTKEDLEKEKTAAEKKAEEEAKATKAAKAKIEKELAELDKITVKNNDDVMGAVVKMAEVMKQTALTNSERVEASKKMEVDLRAHIVKSDEFQNVTETQLGAITAQQEIDQKSIFDIALKSPVLQQWGYSNTIERALYRPHTNYVNGKGWVHDNKAYELDNIVYEINDMLYLTGMHRAIKAQQTDPGSGMTYTKAVKELESFKLFNFELERRPELRKALSTGASGTGAEFIPTGMSAQLLDDLRLELKVAALFATLTIPAGVGSFDYPFRGTRKEAYLQGEAASDSPDKYPATTPGTGKLTFTAVKHALRMLYSDEFNEDSAIAAAPLVRQEIITAIVDAQEDSIINGDTSSIHQDSDTTSATSVRKSYLGLRYHSGGTGGAAAVDIGGMTTAVFRSMEKGMGRFGVNPTKRAWIAGISGFIQMLSISEVLTMDKFGANATIRSGQLAQFDGSPIIVSEFIRQDLNLSGVYNGTQVTDTIILLVHTPAFKNAEKPSGIRIETDRDITTSQNIAVASRRLDFKQVMTPGSSEETVALGYSLTS